MYYLSVYLFIYFIIWMLNIYVHLKCIHSSFVNICGTVNNLDLSPFIYLFIYLF